MKLADLFRGASPLEARTFVDRKRALDAYRADHESEHEARVADLQRQIGEAARERDAAIAADHKRVADVHDKIDRELAADAQRELATAIARWRESTSIVATRALADVIRALDARARAELGEPLGPHVLLVAFAPDGANLGAIVERSGLNEGAVPRYIAQRALALLEQPAQLLDVLVVLDAACAEPTPHHARRSERDVACRAYALASTLTNALDPRPVSPPSKPVDGVSFTFSRLGAGSSGGAR